MTTRGLIVRAKLDMIGDVLAGDIKTIDKFTSYGTDSSSIKRRNNKLYYSCLDFNYFLQFAFYWYGCLKNGFKTKAFYALWIERSGLNMPYATKISDDNILLGQEQFTKALFNYKNRNNSRS